MRNNSFQFHHRIGLNRLIGLVKINQGSLLNEDERIFKVDKTGIHIIHHNNQLYINYLFFDWNSEGLIP